MHKLPPFKFQKTYYCSKKKKKKKKKKNQCKTATL